MFVIIIYKTLINFINNYCLNTNYLYIYIYTWNRQKILQIINKNI